MNEAYLAAMCMALIERPARLSAGEREVVKSATSMQVLPEHEESVRMAILHGGDPLGDALQAIRAPAERRRTGAIYTPLAIVRCMLAWLGGVANPTRIVDPGAGSGRFVLAAARRFPRAELIAVETDPLAALMLRANLSVQGDADRATLLVEDYRDVRLPSHRRGPTAFIGNPPCVRHHEIAAERKAWYAAGFASLGIEASALAGLHLHFFLKTRLLAREGDLGAFITSAEWLDVNYGSALRRLVTGELGGIGLHVLQASVEAFPGTATTAAITCFRVGSKNVPLRVRSIASTAELDPLEQGMLVPRARLQQERRWSAVVRPLPAVQSGEGKIELGQLFRVHRGQVTGANDVWIAGEHSALLPDRLQVPAVTKARDLLRAGAQLDSTEGLRRVIDLPQDLGELDEEERARVGVFLSWARGRGADRGYIARHRKAWWSVGLESAAPILCTYMARRPPQFTLNPCGARHINVAHGLYPLAPLPSAVLGRIVDWLNRNVGTHAGRTYAGGLTKFEPKEIERLRMPSLETLAA